MVAKRTTQFTTDGISGDSLNLGNRVRLKYLPFVLMHSTVETFRACGQLQEISFQKSARVATQGVREDPRNWINIFQLRDARRNDRRVNVKQAKIEVLRLDRLHRVILAHQWVAHLVVEFILIRTN